MLITPIFVEQLKKRAVEIETELLSLKTKLMVAIIRQEIRKEIKKCLKAD